jgi:hypothetical protein
MRRNSALRNCTEVLHDWRIEIQPEIVLRAQGVDPAKLLARHGRFVDLARRAVADGVACIRPRAAFCRFYIEEKPCTSSSLLLEDGTELSGAGLARKLAGAESIVAVVATIGSELELKIEKMRGRDLLLQLALDGFGTAALGELVAAITRYVHDIAGLNGRKATNPVHPGSSDWELAAGQAQIFSLVDAHTVGVSLNASFMMTPRKSVSMVYGIGANVIAGSHACAECKVSLRCRHKAASS